MIALDVLAKHIGITYRGAPLRITAINTLKEAQADELSFIVNAKHLQALKETGAGAVIVTEAFVDAVPSGCEILQVASNPYLYMAKASRYFAKTPFESDRGAAEVGEGSYIGDNVFIADGARIGKACTIMPGCYIGADVVIGENTILHPNVTVYRDCRIGNACMVHANTTIGCDGFGFAHTETGEHVKIYQNGNVVIEDEVEIGSNCTIDRAVFGTTRINKGAKLDNLIQVGHNCIIGEYSLLAAQVGLSGSSELGRNVVMGGQSATAGHLSIAPFTTLAARTGVTKSIEQSGKTFAGFPFMDHRQWLKLQGKLGRLLKS
ncbi:MAG: UDP-3-O-(3-hydroxymyristoyl)glucosamine N-acyltransferase [Sulfurimonas sp.]|nr:MAG: UDP-3-O-(3-hydroxymyristoyl)glucosamine N-acyltransferase [Sulfurimonas sp.]